MKKIIIILSLILLVGCTNDSKIEEENTIYTTIYPIEYITKYLIGDKINVESIIPLDGDAHTYEPTVSVINNVIESDMFIYLGLNLEPSGKSIAKAVTNESVNILEVGSMFEGRETEENHEHENHHIWIDPINMIEIAKIIKTTLLEKYPNFKEIINSNYDSLKDELTQLDEKYTSNLENTKIDTFVVTHDSFKHLDKYGITSIAIKDEAHSKDPSISEINEIIKTMNKKNIKYVAFEQNIPCSPAVVIMQDTKSSKVILHNLSVKTSEDKNKDYIDLMEENLEILTTILN
ncbi:MAG: metal ABC transporter substrate-binding protein [Bacilli bacterium]